MVELGLGFENDLVTSLVQAQAEVHIVISHPEPLIIAADAPIDPRPGCHARSGHRRYVPEQVAHSPPVAPLDRVGVPSPGPDQDALVLDIAVREPQPGTDRADLRPHSLLDKPVEPIGGRDFGVVVQKDQKVAFHGGDGQVELAGVVELMRVAQHLAGQGGQVLEGRGVVALVVHHYQLVVAVDRSPKDALDAAAEQVAAIAGRDDDAHLGFAGPPEPDPVDVEPRTFLGPAAGPPTVFPPVEPVPDGPLGRHPRPGLVLPQGRGRLLVHPPAVERVRYVGDPVRSVGGPEHQVVVLAPVVLGAQPAEAFDQRTP